jgi:hypothetical protein
MTEAAATLAAIQTTLDSVQTGGSVIFYLKSITDDR